jgi:hypothetical protein
MSIQKRLDKYESEDSEDEPKQPLPKVADLSTTESKIVQLAGKSNQEDLRI